MKHKHLLTFLALALALGLGSAAMLSTYANDPETAEACSDEALNSLTSKLNAGTAEIVLDGKICSTENITINQDVTIDLNGHDIYSETANARVLDIKRGNVVIKGQGSIIANDANGAAVRVYGSTDSTATNYTTVTIGNGVNLVGGSNSYGLFVSYNATDYQAYGVTVNFESGSSILGGNGLYINGNLQHDNGPTFNIADGTKIAVAQDGTAIYAAGYGTWNIGAADLSGGTVLGIKAGVANLKGVTMRATSPKVANQPDNNSMNVTGATIQIEQNDGYAGGIDLTIDGGKYTSDQHSVFVTYDTESAARAIGDDFKLQIKNGEFLSADGAEVFDGDFTPNNTVINGGTFTSDVKNLLAANLTQDASGKVISSNPTVTPDPDDQKPDDDKKPTTPSTDDKGKTPDTGVNRASEVSAVFTIGGLGIGVALIAIVALFAAIRRGNVSVEISRESERPTKRSTAKKSTSQRKTTTTSSRKATSSSVKATVRTKRPATRKSTKTVSNRSRGTKKA